MSETAANEKLKALTDMLETGTKAVFESERYKEYLGVMAKFHRYSSRNSLLILLQKPEASHVASFGAWQSMSRSVNKGEKGIQIIAPIPYKRTVEVTRGADGELLPEPQKREIEVKAYRSAYVFDVSQTQGKELPRLVSQLMGTVSEHDELMFALFQASPCPVAFEAMEGNKNGYYNFAEQRIAIREGLSEEQTIKTLVHEIAHARLGHGDNPNIDRQTEEVQAESIAYVVCQHLGIDSSQYSFGYIAGWSKDKELPQLQSSLEVIQKSAQDIIAGVDGQLLERQREKAKKIENGHVRPINIRGHVSAEDVELVAETLSEEIDAFLFRHILAHRHSAGSIQQNLLSGETEWIHKILDNLDEFEPRLEDKIASMEKGMVAIQRLQKAVEQQEQAKNRKKPPISERLDAAKKECAARDAAAPTQEHTQKRQKGMER